MKVSVLILAAGNASRMGKAKQLLPFKNTSLLEHAIHNALESKADNVFCVLGAHANVIINHVGKSKVDFIYNPDWKQGLSTSIISGINYVQSLESIPDAVLVMLADQPFVDSKYIDLMIATFFEKTNTIVASQYKYNKGVPAIFPKEYYQTLLELKGDKGARSLLNNKKLNVVPVFSKSEKTLVDIDLSEDYDKLSQG